MALLITSRRAFRIDEVGDRRSMHPNRGLENVLDRSPKPRHVLLREPRRQSGGMNLRPPETLVSINVADPAEHSLIEQ